MQIQSIRNERIDIRVTPEEKSLFQKACEISGYRSLSSFVTQAIKDKSSEIIEEKERILASDRDRNIFFDALFSEQKPNQALKDAAKKFKSLQG